MGNSRPECLTSEPRSQAQTATSGSRRYVPPRTVTPKAAGFLRRGSLAASDARPWGIPSVSAACRSSFRLKAHLPTDCRQDASSRPITWDYRRVARAPRKLDCAAQSRPVDYACAPPADVCKTSITGSTPVAASNNFPAPGDFRSCEPARGTSEAAGLPTLCRRDSRAPLRTTEYASARSPCSRRRTPPTGDRGSAVE